MATADELEVHRGLSPNDLRSFEQRVAGQIEELRTEMAALKLATSSGTSTASGKALLTVMEKTGESSEDALLLALTLYDLAIDATRQGQRLVLVDQQYRFVREVTDLVGLGPEISSHEKVAG